MTTTALTLHGHLLPGTYTLDPSHSTIGFVARHAMVTKVRGRFADFEGSVEIEGADLSHSTAKAIIRVASIDTGIEERDRHLRTNDFLAVQDFPDITFTSTRVAETTATSLELTGDLTIKNTTRSVTIPFEFKGLTADDAGSVRIAFAGSTIINRKDYGISWNAALEAGGVLVGDKVTLELEVSAVKSD